ISNSVPKFVFVPTAARVARTADKIAAPIPISGVRAKIGPVTTALVIKSTYVTSSKSAPRCTLPTLGAVTSKTTAIVATSPIDIVRRFGETFDINANRCRDLRIQQRHVNGTTKHTKNTKRSKKV